jgi:hypothetical protein
LDSNSLYAFRVQNHNGIKQLVELINGNIRNTIRVDQLVNVCNSYSISYIRSNELTLKSAWFTGFFDAEGSIICYKSSTAYGIRIKVTNKYYDNLAPLITLFNCGKIKFDHKLPADYKDLLPFDFTYDNRDKYPANVLSWSVDNKDSILSLVEYFKNHPPRVPHKNYKLLTLVPEFYRLRSIRAYRPDLSLILG